MLKTMRKNVKALTPTLWIVIATFIIAIFAVWGGGGVIGERKSGTGTLAVVGKTKISSDLYFNTLRQRLQALQQELKTLNKSFIQQLNIPQQVLEQMVQQALILQAAQDMGLSVSNNELRDRIVSFPAFQQDGKFVGFDSYQRVLAYNRITIRDFEESLKKDVLLNKAIRVLTAGVAVTEEEVWENYKKQNESAKLEYLLLDEGKMELAAKPDEVAVRAYFEKNTDRYKIPEKRSALYAFLPTEDLKKEIKLTPADIEKYYKDNIAQFKELEKVKVSRIFLPHTEKDKADILGQVRAIHDRLDKGEDFAELAKKFSKDDKAKDGGDWGLYDWKSLPTAEQEAVAKLEQSKISNVLETDAGAAILKVTEKAPERTIPLDEVKPRIQSILEDDKARELANQRMTQLEKGARRENSLDAAAQKAGIKIANTGLLKQADPVPGVDQAGTISQTLFTLKEKEISATIFTYEGVGVVQLEKIEAPRPAKIEEVKEDVEKDLTASLKKERAREKIKDIRARLTPKNWEEIAQKNNLEIKTIDAHKREQYIGVIGENAEVDTLAFTLPINETSKPLNTPTVSLCSGCSTGKRSRKKTTTRPRRPRRRRSSRPSGTNSCSPGWSKSGKRRRPGLTTTSSSRSRTTSSRASASKRSREGP